jgi:Tfp pilus assembly protein PilO
LAEVTVVLLALVGALVLGYSLGLAHQGELAQALELELAQVQQELESVQQVVALAQAQQEKALGWDLLGAPRQAKALE